MTNLTYLKNVVTLTLAAEKCNGCGLCVTVCPHAVFVIDEKKARILDVDACMECGACAQNCPQEAIFLRPGVGCATKIVLDSLRRRSAKCESAEKSKNCCC